MFLGRACERQIETELTRKFERDATVFGRVRGGKEAAVVAVLHIFAIGFQDARRRAGLRKDFTERFQIKSKRVAQRESFGKAGGVDVHHHVDQCFHFCRLTRFTNKTHRRRQLAKHRFCFPEGRLGPAAH